MIFGFNPLEVPQMGIGLALHSSTVLVWAKDYNVIQEQARFIVFEH